MKKLVLWAALVYLLIAPFTYHPDTKLNLTYPSLDQGKVWNIYRYLEENNNNLPPLHYPPLHFYILKGEFMLTKLAGGQEFVDWLTADSSYAVSHTRIFRFNLISKTPLLLLTLISGYLIYLIVRKETANKVQAKIAAAVWFFNPITLYSVVMMGQNDVIAISLFLLGLLFYNHKPKLAFLIFGLASATKSFPLIWTLLIALSYPKSSLIKKIKLTLIPFGIYLITLLPFFSREYFRQNVIFSGLSTRMFIANIDLGFQSSILIVPALLIVLLFLAIQLKNKNFITIVQIIFAASLIMLGFSHFHPQWILWLMPFLAIIFSLQLGDPQARTKNLLVFTSIFLSFSGIILLFQDKFLQWGIIAPLNPNLLNQPFINEYLSQRGVDTTLLNSLFHSILAGLAIYYLINMFNKTNNAKQARFNMLDIKKPFSNIQMKIVKFLAIPLFFLTMFLTANLVPTIKKVTLNRQQDAIYLPIEELGLKRYQIQVQDDFFYRLEILLKNPELKSEDEFKLRIMEKNGNLLVERTVSGYNVGDPSFFRIDIPILAASKDKVLLIEIDNLIITDGKLQIAQTDLNKNPNLIVNMFFKPPLSLRHTMTQSLNQIQSALINQTEVFLLPAILALL